MAIAGAAAQITAPSQNYNITSPSANAPYVAGQTLPCTVDLFGDSTTDLNLLISLSSAASSNTTLTISSGMVVTKQTGSSKTVNNQTVYEQSTNYPIPTTVTPGAYKVTFLEQTTGTTIDVPINVLAVAASTSSMVPSASGVVASSSSTQGSTFKNVNSGVATITPAKAIVALASVAGIAFML
ncbi:hypothetical protein K501DRAFT_167452 [Backusella circina FSU 941]|nr:hypothetical protein K501DRAFT_167452 [Backusella circina FSU 941]